MRFEFLPSILASVLFFKLLPDPLFFFQVFSALYNSFLIYKAICEQSSTIFFESLK